MDFVKLVKFNGPNCYLPTKILLKGFDFYNYNCLRTIMMVAKCIEYKGIMLCIVCKTNNNAKSRENVVKLTISADTLGEEI